MDELHDSSCANYQKLVLKTSSCEPKKYRNSSHMVKVFEVLQSLRQYVKIVFTF